MNFYQRVIRIWIYKNSQVFISEFRSELDLKSLKSEKVGVGTVNTWAVEKYFYN